MTASTQTPSKTIENETIPQIKKAKTEEMNSSSEELTKNQQQQQKQSPYFKVKKLSSDAILPKRGSAHAAGYDVCSAKEIILPAQGKAIVPTDLSVACPPGTYLRVAPRSGLAVKHFLDIGAGVVDADYRGPLGIVMFNFNKEDYTVKKGDRIAQLIMERIFTPEVIEVEDLDETIRGEGGFGSSGYN